MILSLLAMYVQRAIKNVSTPPSKRVCTSTSASFDRQAAAKKKLADRKPFVLFSLVSEPVLLGVGSQWHVATDVLEDTPFQGMPSHHELIS